MGLNNNFQTFEQLNHNNDKIMSKRPHKGPGVVGGRGPGLRLSIKEVGPEGRSVGALSQFGGDKL